MKRSVFLLLVLSALVISCEHDVIEPEEKIVESKGGDYPVTDCDPDTVYFNLEIERMLIAHCSYSGCHDRVTAKEGLDVTSYSTLIKSDKIKPFDPDDSELYEVLFEKDSDDVMPPPGYTKLTTDQISTLRKWIEQGARNTLCVDSCDTTFVTYSGTIYPILERSCLGCHGKSSELGGFVVLKDYQDVKVMTQDGRILGAIKHLDGYNAMPFGQKKLPVCEINQFEIWIRDGAQNN